MAKKRRPGLFQSLFLLMGNSYLTAQKVQSDIDRTELLNRQREEDIKLKKQRQTEMIDRIEHRRNQVILQDLQIELLRQQLGYPPEKKKTDDFTPAEYDV